MSFTYTYAGQRYQHCCEHRSADHPGGGERCLAAVGIVQCACTHEPSPDSGPLANRDPSDPFDMPADTTVNTPRETPWTVTAYGLNGKPMLFEKHASRGSAHRRAQALLLRSDVSRVKGEPA